jgi:hypothetical protein
MVSPSATPTTLPDQAQAGQGSTSRKITARYMVEVIRLDMIQFPKKLISRPLPVSQLATGSGQQAAIILQAEYPRLARLARLAQKAMCSALRSMR